jgi:hypothetical protein
VINGPADQIKLMQDDISVNYSIIKSQISQLQLQIVKITFVYPEEIKAIKKMKKMDSELENKYNI